jgi:hypothetical protein
MNPRYLISHAGIEPLRRRAEERLADRESWLPGVPVT